MYLSLFIGNLFDLHRIMTNKLYDVHRVMKIVIWDYCY